MRCRHRQRNRKAPDGIDITVDCSQGDEGYVYRGLLKYTVKETDLASLARPKTKIMMNIGNPEQAFEESFIPNDRVGRPGRNLSLIPHQDPPLALLRFSEVKDEETRQIIENLTYNWQDKSQYFRGQAR
jgi:pyruvate,water dikinase